MIKTKLYRPPVTDEIIERPKLLEVFGNFTYKSLVLFVAPAGYGKSIAISQWLSSQEKKYGWFSIDKEDNDLQLFLSYVIAALKSALHDKELMTEELLLNPTLPPYATILRVLINDLDQVEDELILVLDDFHLIKNKMIHDLIFDLATYSPSNFQLIIASRSYPPFNLSKLRIQNSVFEVNMSELRFDRSEFKSLVELHLYDLQERHFQDVMTYTEGWPIGLIMTLHEMKKSSNKNLILERLKNSGANFYEIFMQEIFANQSPTIQKLLILTARLDRFSRDLIDFICVQNSFCGDDWDKEFSFIRHLRQNNLFIVALDSDDEWFRYHHLFQEFLIRIGQKFLNESTFDHFFQITSTWFKDHQLTTEALGIAMKKTNISYAVAIFEERRNHLINAEQFNKLRILVDKFPNETIVNHLSLLLSRVLLSDTKASYAEMQADLLTAKSKLDQIESKSADLNLLAGEYHSLSSALKYFTGDVKGAIEHADTAHSLLPNDYGYFREFALGIKAMALYSAGSAKHSMAIVKEALNNHTIHDSVIFIRNQTIQSLIYAMDGNLESLKETTRAYLLPAKNKGLIMSWFMSSFLLGVSYYQTNQLKKAKEYLEPLVFSNYFGRPFWNIIASCFYVKTLIVLKEKNDLQLFFKNLDEVVTGLSNNEMYLQMLTAVKAEVNLFDRSFSTAQNLANKFDLSTFPKVFFFYFPQLTTVKLLLCEGDIYSLKRSVTILDEHIDQARHLNNDTFLIQSLALKSIYFYKMNSKKRSLECLTESIEKSKGTLHTRTYLDLGEMILPVISLLKKGSKITPLMMELIRAFEQTNDHFNCSENLESNRSKDQLQKPLSKRETEILTMAAEGYKNMQIAESIYVSEDTVKKHLYNVYKKLAVKNRVSAILKARELGFFK